MLVWKWNDEDQSYHGYQNGEYAGVSIAERDTIYNGRPDRAYDVVTNWGDTFQAATAWATAEDAAERLLANRR